MPEDEPPAPTRTGPDRIEPETADLDATELATYFALIEVVGLLRHAIERQLRETGDLSYVQFQLLARLGDSPTGSERMTELADGVVYSRSGLTYQAGLLEDAGLVRRAPSVEDDRGVTVSITTDGRQRLAAVFPGHIDVVRRMLFDRLSRAELESFGALLGPMRDHMRAAPARSATTRRRGTAS